VICAAIAARQVGRPVKLVLTREQMYGSLGFRPNIKQRVRLCATREGKLTGIAHDGINGTSTMGTFVEPVGLATRLLYSCPNVTVTHRLIRLDTQTPTFMRAPGEATGTFALESAMDELAYLLNMDPLELRLVNYAERNEDQDLPWSSKALRECYEQGAMRFGWARRDPRPGSMRDGRMLLGWGMATATYPTNLSPADASLRLGDDGRVRARCATEDLGTGAYTVLTQVVAEALALSPERVILELGDTNLPRGPIAAGSQTTASVGCALAATGQAIIEKLCELAISDLASPLFGADRRKIVPLCGRLVLKSDPGRGESYEKLMARQGLPFVEAGIHSKGEGDERFSSHAFGAQFAEVRIDPDLGTIRVSRFVGAFAAGRIANAKTARSQLMGGITMGIGLALLEKGVRDPRWGRVVNADLADYLVPVNADVPSIEAFFVAEEDAHVNPLGLKGMGELGITGAGAAIANAVFHATGKRIRDLPITLERLL
jgi:xanthine dehydrogenase YagR molybdenum-binding subunit